MKLKIWQIIVTILYLVTIPRLILNNFNEKNSPFTDYVIFGMWALLIILTLLKICIFLSEKHIFENMKEFLNKEIKI